MQCQKSVLDCGENTEEWEGVTAIYLHGEHQIHGNQQPHQRSNLPGSEHNWGEVQTHAEESERRAED